MKFFFTAVVSALACAALTACSEQSAAPADLVASEASTTAVATLTPRPASSFTLTIEQASENFTTIEWAFQESKFCSANGFAATELFGEWMKQHDEAYRASVKAVEENVVKQGNNNRFDRAAAVLSMVKEKQREVAAKVMFTTAKCKDFPNTLLTLSDQMHPRANP